ncbi:hypothetical protein J3E68DRAFT_440486 [Trichoderma sp. SZMC 28012]
MKCALLVQILKGLSIPHPDKESVFFIPRAFRSLYDTHFPSKTPPMEELDSVLIEVIDLSEETFLIIDALDECDSEFVRGEAITFLASLLVKVKSKLHILITSRLEGDIETKISQVSIPTSSVALHATDVDRDIRKHLRALMREEDSFKAWSHALKNRVIEHLVENADGVFRWADLQIQGLRGKTREIDVNRALKRLPHDLGETYSRILQRIDLNNYKLEAMVVLRWLACSTRPLNLAEIAELAVFDAEESDEANLLPSSSKYEISCVYQNRFSSASEVLNILSGLVISTQLPDKDSKPHNSIVSFSHFSVKEYLQSNQVEPSYFKLMLSECHCCNLDAPYDILLRATLDFNQPMDIQVKTSTIMFDSDKQLQFSPVSGIVQTAIDQITSKISVLGSGSQRRPSSRTDTESRIAVWKILQAEPQVQLNAKDRDGKTPLLLAAVHGDEDFFKYLFAKDGIETDIQESHGWDLLTCALLGKNITIIKIILDRGNFDLDHMDLYGRTNFEWSTHLGLHAVLASASMMPEVSHQTSEMRQIPFTVVKEIATDGEVWACIFSQDGSRLALCLSSNKALIFDLQNDELQSTLDHEKPVTKASWSPDDSLIVTLCLDGKPSDTLGIMTVEISDGHYRPWIEVQGLRVQSSAMSRDGKWLVAVTYTKELLIFQVAAAELANKISLSERPSWVSISDGLGLILMGYVDGGFDIRLLPSGEVIQQRPGISNTDFLLQGSVGGENDTFLLRSEENGYISIWDLNSGTLAGLEHGHYPERTNFATWSPVDSCVIASGGDDHKCRIILISAKASPPAAIDEYCRQKGQFAQLVKGVWKCVQISDVCSPGTAADDVWYKSETGAMVHFYGSCSTYTPCLGRKVVPWTRGVSHKRLGQDGEIYIGQYDDDLVLTIADTETTSEQYTVFADGVKLGSTHGRLTLGEDKYKRSNIRMVDVGSGAAGALRSIANDGFWGSFKIPRGAKKITIVDDSSDFDFAFEYRLDTACSC